MPELLGTVWNSRFLGGRALLYLTATGMFIDKARPTIYLSVSVIILLFSRSDQLQYTRVYIKLKLNKRLNSALATQGRSVGNCHHNLSIPVTAYCVPSGPCRLLIERTARARASREYNKINITRLMTLLLFYGC